MDERKSLNYSNITVISVCFRSTLGRTIPSFRMVIDQEIEVLARTFGKKLPDKEERKLLRDTLQLCKRHSHSCSESVRLVPMHSILLAILLEQEKSLNEITNEISSHIKRTGQGKTINGNLIPKNRTMPACARGKFN